jgi:hypothetical protein
MRPSLHTKRTGKPYVLGLNGPRRYVIGWVSGGLRILGLADCLTGCLAGDLAGGLGGDLAGCIAG